MYAFLGILALCSHQGSPLPEGLTGCLSPMPRLLLRDCISKNLSQNLLWANTVQYLFRSPVFCPFGKVMHEKGMGRVRINDIKVGVGGVETFPLGTS